MTRRIIHHDGKKLEVGHRENYPHGEGVFVKDYEVSMGTVKLFLNSDLLNHKDCGLWEKAVACGSGFYDSGKDTDREQSGLLL